MSTVLATHRRNREVPDSYHAYLAAEWDLFAADLGRQEEARRLAAEMAPRRVLDVGCGGGQDLIPFAAAGADCVGLDIAHESAVWATNRFRVEQLDAKARFVTGAAEQLPFERGTFDLILCRLAIPYADNVQAFSEMSRVLHPRGVVILKTHTLRYYVRKFAEGVRQHSPLFSVHAIRVIFSGFLYHLLRRQPQGGFLIREVFQTDWLLRKELARVGLAIQREMPGSGALSRTYRINKVA